MSKKKEKTYNEKQIEELEKEVEEIKERRKFKIRNPFKRFTKDQGMSWD